MNSIEWTSIISQVEVFNDDLIKIKSSLILLMKWQLGSVSY